MGLLQRIFGSRSSRAFEWQVRHYHHLMMLTPSGFEHALADLLRDMGFGKVEVSGGAGDLGADIRGRDEHGRSFVAQCKKYDLKHRVGSREMQLFIGMSTTHHRAERRMYFTTSTFTEPAIGLAHKHKIELFDGNRLAEVMTELRGEPEPGPELPVKVLLQMGVRPGLLSLFEAREVQEQEAARRWKEAKAAACQCIQPEAEWSLSGDVLYLYDELVMWCPACGRPATERERKKARRSLPPVIEPPPDWKPPKGWKAPVR